MIEMTQDTCPIFPKYFLSIYIQGKVESFFQQQKYNRKFEWVCDFSYEKDLGQ